MENIMGSPDANQEFNNFKNPPMAGFEVNVPAAGGSERKISLKDIPAKLLHEFENEWLSTPGLVKYQNKPNKKMSGDYLMNIYLNEISETPLLTKEGERVLAQYIEAGKVASDDVEDFWRGVWAKDKLIKSNLRLVVSIAKRYPRSDTPLTIMDLIQEGSIGLEKAAEKFDWRKGFKFSTYATWWVKQSVGRHIAKGSLINIPQHKVEQIRALMNAENYLSAIGERPTNKKLAERIGVSVDELNQLKSVRRMLGVVSLDRTLSLDGSGIETDATLADLIGGDDSGYEVVNDRFAAESIAKILLNLDDRARDVIHRRFGFNGYKPHSLEDIAQAYGITRERVRQIEQRAINALKSLGDIGDYEELLS